MGVESRFVASDQSAMSAAPAGRGGGSRRPRRGGGPFPESGEKSTRERILDIALDLFTEHGYEQTSLREIAEQLGVTKAALYYHFASKDEILMALHERLHEVAQDTLRVLGTETVTKEAWAALLDSLIEKIPPNRQLLLMHERNRTAFEKLHHPDHAVEHEDLEERLRRVLNDAAVPLRDRIRMGCAFASIMGGLIFGGDAFGGAHPDELVDELKSVVRDLLETSDAGVPVGSP
jgi:AcrR family transcriptional regulator